MAERDWAYATRPTRRSRALFSPAKMSSAATAADDFTGIDLQETTSGDERGRDGAFVPHRTVPVR